MTLDPFSAVVHPDPYPWYEWLASQRPAARDERLGAWIVAGDVAALVQTLDATAGPAGNALVGWARRRDGDDHAALVRATVTRDPSVHNTRRWARDRVDLLGRLVEAGDASVVVLASTDAVFGGGRHRCPGDDVAVALATGILDALTGPAERLAPLMTRPCYRPRPNVRIPWFGGADGPAA